MNFRNFEDREEFLSRAEAYLEQGLPDRAIALAEERLNRFPGDVDARIILGSSLIKNGKTDEALKVLKSVEEDIIKWSNVFECLGDIYQEKGITEKAIKDYQRFVSLNPDSPITKDVSAKLDYLTSSTTQDDLIPEELDDSIEDVSPDFYTITLAELYKKQGHLETAGKILKEILKADPGNIKAAEILNELKAALEAEKAKVFSEEKRASVINELNRWLENLNKIKRYAAY
ncbi:MAG: tetratricopeptide repeat protein [Syntrophales bacterium]|nr:tetratricopeptide repeat protein [Syntrophales bacterium]